MHIFEWEDSYSVKVSRLDDQHKHFFEIVKELHDALENKEDRIAMAMILHKLVNYTKSHFKEEETYLFKNQYPHYEQHKKQHDAFIKKVEQYVADYNSGKHLLHFDILPFLKNWVANHILVVDKHFADYLNPDEK